jgi:hypothetical protein
MKMQIQNIDGQAELIFLKRKLKENRVEADHRPLFDTDACPKTTRCPALSDRYNIVNK